MAQPSIGSNGEIHELSHEGNDAESPEIDSLPRADGGKAAWTTLAGCFFLEAVVWGLPFSYGVFQKYYSTHEPFRSKPSGIAAISTTAIAIMFFASPFVALGIQRYPWIRFRGGLLGLAVMNAALVAASCCNSVSVLLATQGVLYAVGGLILYFPAMYLIDEWFIARKGLAIGILWTGHASGGAVLPYLLQWLLDNYGFRTALRVWTVILTAVALPSLLVMKNRLPTTGSRTFRPRDLTFLRQPPFWIYQIPSIIQSIAYYLPLMWLPSFAAAMGLPSFSGAIAVSLVNLSAGVGYVFQGRLVDRFHATVAIFISTIGGMITVFVFWGLATNQAMLYTFSILWGLTGGSFPGSWTGCAKDMRQWCRNLDTGLVLSLMCAGKGIGSVVSGPISAQLLEVPPWKDLGFAYGSKYGAMIVFTGVGVTLGGTGGIARLFVSV